MHCILLTAHLYYIITSLILVYFPVNIPNSYFISALLTKKPSTDSVGLVCVCDDLGFLSSSSPNPNWDCPERSRSLSPGRSSVAQRDMTRFDPLPHRASGNSLMDERRSRDISRRTSGQSPKNLKEGLSTLC